MKKGLSIYALDTSGYLAVPYAEDGVQAGSRHRRLTI